MRLSDAEGRMPPCGGAVAREGRCRRHRRRPSISRAACPCPTAATAPAAGLERRLAAALRPHVPAVAAGRHARLPRCCAKRLGLPGPRRRVRVARHADLGGETGRAAESLLPAVLAHRAGNPLQVRGVRSRLPVVVDQVDLRAALPRRDLPVAVARIVDRVADVVVDEMIVVVAPVGVAVVGLARVAGSAA